MQAVNSHFLEVPLCDLTGYKFIPVLGSTLSGLTSALQSVDMAGKVEAVSDS